MSSDVMLESLEIEGFRASAIVFASSSALVQSCLLGPMEQERPASLTPCSGYSSVSLNAWRSSADDATRNTSSTRITSPTLQL